MGDIAEESFSVLTWRRVVENGGTFLGYQEWAALQRLRRESPFTINTRKIRVEMRTKVWVVYRKEFNVPATAEVQSINKVVSALQECTPYEDFVYEPMKHPPPRHGSWVYIDEES